MKSETRKGATAASGVRAVDTFIKLPSGRVAINRSCELSGRYGAQRVRAPANFTPAASVPATSSNCETSLKARALEERNQRLSSSPTTFQPPSPRQSARSQQPAASSLESPPRGVDSSSSWPSITSPSPSPTHPAHLAFPSTSLRRLLVLVLVFDRTCFRAPRSPSLHRDRVPLSLSPALPDLLCIYPWTAQMVPALARLSTGQNGSRTRSVA